MSQVERLKHLVGHLVGAHRHEPGHPIDTAMESSRRAVRATNVSLVALGLTAAAQLAVALITGSVALLSDTLHNFADAGTALPLWLAFTLGRRRPNDSYTYGYGRAEDLAALVVLVAIAASAVLAAWTAFQRLLDPVAPTHLWAVAIAGVVGAAGNEAVARYRMRVGGEIGSVALVADGHHARADALTSIAVTAGAVAVALGAPIADAVAGLVISAVIVRVLVESGRDVLRRLMDAVDPRLVEQVETVAGAVPGVEALGSVRIRWIGHRLHAELEVLIDGGLTVADGHAIAEDVRHDLLHGVARLGSALVHADPASDQDPHQQVAHHPEPAWAAAKADRRVVGVTYRRP